MGVGFGLLFSNFNREIVEANNKKKEKGAAELAECCVTSEMFEKILTAGVESLTCDPPDRVC